MRILSLLLSLKFRVIMLPGFDINNVGPIDRSNICMFQLVDLAVDEPDTAFELWLDQQATMMLGRTKPQRPG